MERKYEKRMFSRDGKYRVTLYYDECPSSPRDLWDPCFHCEDWIHGYSIMEESERKNSSRDARGLLEYLLRHYGNEKGILDALFDAGRKLAKGEPTDLHFALQYDKTHHGYALMLKEHYYSVYPQKEEWKWVEAEFFDCPKKCIDLDELFGNDNLPDEAIDWMVKEYMGDDVRMLSYEISNYSMSFYSDVTCNSGGILYVLKEEAVGEKKMYDEQWWAERSAEELLAGYTDEIVAWHNGEVYYGVAEKKVKWQTHRHCTSEERPDEDYEEEEWENIGSLGGFYGDIDYAISETCDCADGCIDPKTLIDEDDFNRQVAV